MLAPDSFQKSEGDPVRIRILIADDHSAFRSALATGLQFEPDFEIVSEAADGQAAVEQVAHFRPDVVLMDIWMPRLDGIEATRQIAASYPGTKVIGLSVERCDQAAPEMQQAGARGYLSKDARLHQVITAIRAICGRHAASNPITGAPAPALASRNSELPQAAAG